MNLELIAPAIHEKTKIRGNPISFISPFNLAVLAAFTPKDIEINITDEDVEEINFEVHLQ